MKRKVLLVLILPVVLLVAGCVSTQNRIENYKYVSDIETEPNEMIEDITEYLTQPKDNKDRVKYFNAYSYAQEQLSRQQSPGAMESLFNFIKGKSYFLAYPVARDLYQYQPETYTSVYQRMAISIGLDLQNLMRFEKPHYLPLQAHAAAAAWKLSNDTAVRSQLAEVFKEPGLAPYGYPLVLEAGMETEAQQLYSIAMEHSPLLLQAQLREAGFSEEAERVQQELIANPRTNQLSLFLSEDFSDNSGDWHTKEVDGISRQVEDGVYRLANNRSGDSYDRRYFTVKSLYRKYDSWNYLAFDCSSISREAERDEFWVGYGGLYLHFDRDRGYSITTRGPGIDYSSIDYNNHEVQLTPWKPLPEDINPGESFRIGIYPGNDEALLTLGEETVVQLKGIEYPKRANKLVIGLMPGAAVEIDNLRLYQVHRPSSSIAALPSQVYQEYSRNKGSADLGDWKRWIADPFLQAYHFEEVLTAAAEELTAEDLLAMETEAIREGALDFVSNYTRAAGGLEAEGMELPVLSGSQISEELHNRIDELVTEGEEKTLSTMMRRLFAQYRFAAAQERAPEGSSIDWVEVIGNDSWFYESSYHARKKQHEERTGRAKFAYYGKNSAGDFENFSRDLFNLGAKDIKAAWEELQDAGEKERTAFALYLYGPQNADQQYTFPLKVRSRPYYLDTLSNSSEWKEHKQEEKGGYSIYLVDSLYNDFKAGLDGLFLWNEDNGDSEHTYFWTRHSITPEEYRYHKNNGDARDLLEVSLFDAGYILDIDKENTPSQAEVYFAGWKVSIRDNREYMLEHYVRSRDVFWVKRDWTPYPGSREEGRTHITFYADEGQIVFAINNEDPIRLESRNDDNMTKKGKLPVTFYTFEGSAFFVEAMSLRDSVFIPDPWLSEIQLAAFTELVQADYGDDRSWGTAFALLAESYYRDRDLFDRELALIRDALIREQAVQESLARHLIEQGNWLVLEHIGIKTTRPSLETVGLVTRRLLNTKMLEYAEDPENDSLIDTLSNLHYASEHGYIRGPYGWYLDEVKAEGFPLDKEERTDLVNSLINLATKSGNTGERMKNIRWDSDPDFLLNLFQIDDLVYLKNYLY
ncbi:MAG: hypothetical protein K9L68_06755 [Spirochaetales bacterium]|nr:hypothetical protein [Spirochaetales bacterium]MCF7938284.1 hypothetical protein [Spirochaetales bacterium]